MNNIQSEERALSSLKAGLQGSFTGRFDFSSAAIAMYTSDASNYRQVPIGVAYPRNSSDIKSAVKLCAEHGFSILMRGGGTSQNGQCVNNSLILDCSEQLTNVIELDIEQQTAVVEPGIVCDALKAEAEQHGLTFGPDPATHSRCTLGGMIGNNSCGPHSMLAGKTVENVLELEVLTSDGHCFWVGPTSNEELENIISAGGRKGEIYAQLKQLINEHADDVREKFPNIKRRVSGYNLDQLLPENGFNVARALVGTEGTCVCVLQAKVKLIEAPKFVQLVVLGFSDIFLAGDAVARILPFKPIAMEGLDWNIVGGLNDRNLQQREVSQLPEGRAWLLVEIASSTEEGVHVLSEQFCTAMQADEHITSVLKVHSKQQEKDLWSIREQGASATSMALKPGDTDPVVGWEDTAVDPLQLGDYLRALYELVDRYGYKTSLYGHFGDGCIHARMTFDTRSVEGVAKWRLFSKDIAQLVVRFGGSLSGEHGDGQAKAEFLPAMFGQKLVEAFEAYKQIWDPDLRMNPRKVVHPYRMDENLRYGPDYKTPNVPSTLNFVEDIGGLGRASERCIGMGKCRSASGAMCPSYQATNEERYSTRGRAHLLHELMRGELIEDGWQNQSIADSLEHCLSCKACKTSCPTKVDIAAYKSEFMHRHYQNRRRPIQHYVFGHIGSWLPMTKWGNPLLTLFSKRPLSWISNRVLGLHHTSALPKVAKKSFADYVKANATHSDERFHYFGDRKHDKVILWADSVNTYLSPQVLRSAVNVLLKTNYQVAIAKAHFCCGRPLYEYGFLEKAEQHTQAILDQFYTSLPTGASVVVLEPSCLSVFQDELGKLHPNNPSALDLKSRTVSLIQFLIQANVVPDKKLDSAVLHTHCHDKSLGIGTQEMQWLSQCFTHIEEPEESCCGMAGTYGLQSNTAAIGKTLFDKKLGPAIEASAEQSFAVSNGYSCRTQINKQTGRRAYHMVEIIEQCLA